MNERLIYEALAHIIRNTPDVSGVWSTAIGQEPPQPEGERIAQALEAEMHALDAMHAGLPPDVIYVDVLPPAPREGA